MATREAAPADQHLLKPNDLPKPNGSATVAPSTTGTKAFEKEESHKPQETLKEEAEPKTKVQETKPSHEEAKLPGNKPEPHGARLKPSDIETKLPTNKIEPPSAEPKTPQGEAKLPGEKSEPRDTRAKPPQTPKASHEPPHVVAGPNGRPNPKPPVGDKKPE
jgi:hypothetical protein